MEICLVEELLHKRPLGGRTPCLFPVPFYNNAWIFPALCFSSRGLAASHSSKDPPSLAYWLFASPQLISVRWCCRGRAKRENEPFSTAELSERVENSLFRATREYTEAGIEQAIVAMRRLGANSPEPRKRTVREWHVSTQKTGSYITERSRLPGLIVGPCPSEESLCCPACPPALPCFRRVSAPSL